MVTWVILLISNLVIPALMIGLGTYFYRHPPQEINPNCGYRTAMSEKNRDTWIFANRYCGRVFCLGGLILLAPTLAAMVVIRLACGGSRTATLQFGLLVLLVQVAVLLLAAISTETALRKTFDKYGNRR